MITQIELEQKIIKITCLIHKDFPELAKYVTEMPANNAENDEVNIKTLEEYFHSLRELLDKYAKTHLD